MCIEIISYALSYCKESKSCNSYRISFSCSLQVATRYIGINLDLNKIKSIQSILKK